MFKEGPVPAFVHGVVEYLAAILFIAAPFIFSFDEDMSIAVSLIVGVLVLIIAASTAWRTGLINSIPIQAHVMLDYVLAIFLIAAPFVLGFSDDGTAAAFFIVVGVIHLLLTIATRFVSGRAARAGASGVFDAIAARGGAAAATSDEAWLQAMLDAEAALARALAVAGLIERPRRRRSRRRAAPSASTPRRSRRPRRRPATRWCR